jgi:hypothetical protein
MVRILVCGMALVAVVSCDRGAKPTGAPAEVPAAPTAKPVELTLTAEELAKAYDADPAAYKVKYGGKRVELSGIVVHPRLRVGGLNGVTDVLLLGLPQPKEVFARLISVTPRASERDRFEGMKALAKGQAVTVRGDVQTFGVVLADCEFVKVGPSTALPVTASGLKAALQTDEGKAKYDGKAVVLRGEVQKAEWNGTVASLTVVDPGEKGGPGLEASVNPSAKEIGEALGKTKPGTHVIILGEGSAANDGRVWDFRLLTALPEGITLPGNKQ